MKQNLQSVIGKFALLMVIIAVFVGQAAAFTNYIADGTVSFEDKSSGSQHLSNVQAYQDSGKLTINAYVVRNGDMPVFTTGHVDIVIVSPDGNIVQQRSTGFRKIEGNPSKTDVRRISFTSSFPLTPSRGTKVRAAYHDSVSSVSSAFDCGTNAAL